MTAKTIVQSGKSDIFWTRLGKKWNKVWIPTIFSLSIAYCPRSWSHGKQVDEFNNRWPTWPSESSFKRPINFKRCHFFWFSICHRQPFWAAILNLKVKTDPKYNKIPFYQICKARISRKWHFLGLNDTSGSREITVMYLNMASEATGPQERTEASCIVSDWG